LTADALHDHGIKKVTTHLYLNAIVLLASAIAASRSAKAVTLKNERFLKILQVCPFS
jgi:hypothetical protein